MRHRIALVAGLSWASLAYGDHFEPLHEQPGAVAAGAAAVAEATQAEKTDKQKAVYLFRQLVDEHPAALHECYLALAYLRVDELTEAKLAMDIAAQMGGERPKWCTGAVAQELDKKLADGHFIEVQLELEPPDQLVSINNFNELVRITSLWWRDGRSLPLVFTAPGYERQASNVTPTAASSRVTIRLEPVKPAVAPEPAPPPPPEPAAQPPRVDTPPPPPPVKSGRRGGQKAIALGVTLANAALAGTSFYLMHYFHDQAQGRYPTDPRFDDSHVGWEITRDFGLGFSGLAVLSSGYLLYLAISGDRDVPKLDGPGLHLDVTAHSAGVGWGWTLP